MINIDLEKSLRQISESFKELDKKIEECETTGHHKETRDYPFLSNNDNHLIVARGFCDYCKTLYERPPNEKEWEEIDSIYKELKEPFTI